MNSTDVVELVDIDVDEPEVPPVPVELGADAVEPVDPVELVAAEVVAVLDEFDGGMVGLKLSLPGPNPIFDANKPLTETGSVLFKALMTSCPLVLR